MTDLNFTTLDTVITTSKRPLETSLAMYMVQPANPLTSDATWYPNASTAIKVDPCIDGHEYRESRYCKLLYCRKCGNIIKLT